MDGTTMFAIALVALVLYRSWWLGVALLILFWVGGFGI